MEKRDYSLSSVRNGMKILRLFTADEPVWGVTEMAERVGLSKSSAHRLIATLHKQGYLEREKNGKYRLGLALLSLTGIITAQTELYRESLPILKELAEELGETVHINVLEGSHVVYLHKVECKQPVRLLSDIGKRNPAHCSSAGKVLLAYQGQEAICRFLQKNELRSYGPNTITDPEDLLDNLMQIKRQGYSIAVEEMHEGVVSIAIPVSDYTGEVTAAISVVGPLQRMTENRFSVYVKTLQKSGRKLSEKLGYIESVQLG